MDGIDLATYYCCYCVHMICNHDLEWGGWKAGMGTKESIFEVGKMTLHVKYINPIMKQKPLSAKKKKADFSPYTSSKSPCVCVEYTITP